MDVVKPKVEKSRLSQKQILSIVAVAVLFALVFLLNQSAGQQEVKRSDILVGQVKQGNLEVVIEGYGQLVSAKQQLVTALTRATVKEIVLKPGAEVTSDSVIVRLENPELVQQVQSDTQELALMEANLRQLKLNQKRESLYETATVTGIKANLQGAKLKRESEQKLLESGIVSQLTFKQSLLHEQQFQQQLEILSQRREQLTAVHKEAVTIELEKIKQYQGRLAIAKERVERLTVRAGFDGVLQRLSVALGQSLDAGQEIALIGGVTELIALIRVPQAQAQQVVVGQKAWIDTRGDKIQGQVARIDPVVENNTVNIEIILPEQLPQSARPQLNVDGTIIADTLNNVHYIERPANAQSNSQRGMFKLDSSAQTARLQQVRFGRRAGRFIEIVSTVKPNEQFIVSDLSGLVAGTSQLSISL